MNLSSRVMSLRGLFSIALSSLGFLFFLQLGRDNLESTKVVRFYAEALLFALTLIVTAKLKISFKPFHSLSFCLFFLFILFQLTRYVVFLSPFADAVKGGSHGVDGLVRFPLEWLAAFGIFWIYMQGGSQQANVVSLGRTFVWASFFLALNGLPALLLTGQSYYLWAHQGNTSYFFPFFYFADWVEKYILIRNGHVNITGDILALGVFPALGFSIYALHLWRTSRRSGEMPMPGDEPFLRGPAFIFLYTLAAMTSVSCLLLHLSRGTMVSFFVAVTFFCGALVLKFVRRKNAILLAGGLLLAVSFLAWSVNLPKVITELQSLQGEEGQQGTSSFANAKGQMIAEAIYHRYPIWGAGNGGYKRLAEKYDPEFSEEARPIYHLTAISHYYQILAEQGAGAFIYFLFLSAWLIELVTGLIRTKSYFKFVMALSFASGVILVLVHASFGFLMDQFPTAALTYIGMGVSLAITKKSFKHD